MTDHREAPLVGNRFLVSIGDDDGRDPSAGFAEVIFPPFEHRHDPAHAPADAPPPLLVLRRGVTGRLDLYDWWDVTRLENTPPTRTVTIQLLGDDLRAVMTWRFLRAYPVSLTYSPLNAMSTSVVMEQIALAFERVEMS
ncbi:MAG: phage tail protein [Vicinamibacterales bacterium]